MSEERRLLIPAQVPEDFANAVATIMLLGIAGSGVWDRIFSHPPEQSLQWIDGILKANDLQGLVHSDIDWWELQLKGH